MSDFDRHLNRLPAIVRTLSGQGDASMWDGRTISMWSSLLKALEHGNPLGLSGSHAVRHYMALEHFIELTCAPSLNEEQQNGLCDYLASLPGYQPHYSHQSEIVLDNHGYLQMQLTRLVGCNFPSAPHITPAQSLIDEVLAPLQRQALVVVIIHQFDAWQAHDHPSIKELSQSIATLRPDLFDDVDEVQQCLNDVLAHPTQYQLQHHHHPVYERHRFLTPEMVAQLIAADLHEKLNAPLMRSDCPAPLPSKI